MRILKPRTFLMMRILKPRACPRLQSILFLIGFRPHSCRGNGYLTPKTICSGLRYSSISVCMYVCLYECAGNEDNEMYFSRRTLNRLRYFRRRRNELHRENITFFHQSRGKPARVRRGNSDRVAYLASSHLARE